MLVYVLIGSSLFDSNRRMSQLTVSPISGFYCIYIYIYIDAFEIDWRKFHMSYINRSMKPPSAAREYIVRSTVRWSRKTIQVNTSGLVWMVFFQHSSSLSECSPTTRLSDIVYRQHNLIKSLSLSVENIRYHNM